MKKTNLIVILFVFIISSCSSTKWKSNTKEPKKTEEKQAELKSGNKITVKKIITKKAENWADDYYQKTYFIVHNPKILESYNELVAVCKSKDFKFVSNYQNDFNTPIRYKETPINITTKKGFSKTIFITKGACREFSLSKSHKIPSPKQIRKSIKKMVLIYIYNQGTFLKETEFHTPFSDVNYLVE